MKSDSFFLDNLNPSGSTSHQKLSEIDTEHAVSSQINNIDPRPMVSPTIPSTTPLSNGSGGQNIKIEISGQPEAEESKHLQQLMYNPAMSPHQESL